MLLFLCAAIGLLDAFKTATRSHGRLDIELGDVRERGFDPDKHVQKVSTHCVEQTWFPTWMGLGFSGGD